MLETPAKSNATQPRPDVRAPARPVVLRSSARYWTCVVIMALAAVGVGVLPQWLGLHFQKQAVPLKVPLQQFDARKLAPRYERHPASDHIKPLSADMIESLGTEEYLQVYLRDTTKPADAPTAVVNLFVTYYTGQPDMVPHVPDECYHAGGYDKLGADTRQIRVRGVGAADDEVPVRVVRFVAPANRRRGGTTGETCVTYFFHVNAGYATTRNGVRLRLSNPTESHAYYAKIEVTFTDDGLKQMAGEQASVAALQPLLEALMPVLFDDHFDLSVFPHSSSGTEVNP